MSETQTTTSIQDLLNRQAMSTQEALGLCDALPTVPLDTLMGRWRGSEIVTGHPLNGLLGTFGWYGKEFIDIDHVHPLLFSTPSGHLFRVDPQRLPVSLAPKLPIPRTPLLRYTLPLVRPLLQTRHSKARLRLLEYRGKLSATMIYDNLPIYDTFRLIDADTLLGIMDYKAIKQPFFFKLQRDGER